MYNELNQLIRYSKGDFAFTDICLFTRAKDGLLIGMNRWHALVSLMVSTVPFCHATARPS